LDALQEFFIPVFPSRNAFEISKKKIMDWIKESLDTNTKQILQRREELKISERNTHSAEKKDILRRANNIDRRVKTICIHLANDLYGVPEKLGGSKDNIEVNCCVCMKCNKNLTDCEHNVCPSCFATIVFKNSGNFVCPICRECKNIVENIEDEKVYFYDSEVSDIILCICAIMFFL
jgi:hypothetical protein